MHENLKMQLAEAFNLSTGPSSVGRDVGPREATMGQTQNIPNSHHVTDMVTNVTVMRSPLSGRILGIPERLYRMATHNIRKRADRRRRGRSVGPRQCLGKMDLH